MFCDSAKIKVTAGRGGDGIVSMRREKFIPYGGPDGGDGGTGGAVIFIVDDNLHTLSDYRTQKHFRAESGVKGGPKKMHGRNGKDLCLKVPTGTLIYNEGKTELYADMVKKGQTYTFVEGGRGGFGNAHFKSSTRKTPHFAENGEPGEEKSAQLELKMIAEIGIIGLPSAGKSTLISKISNAKPKIAAYHFTTLVPNLGVVSLSKFVNKAHGDFMVADIPGLIEGASQGKGIGDAFLKHIQRTRVLVHMIDATDEDVVKNYKVIVNELKTYDPELATKNQIIVLNKVDMLEEKEVEKKKKALQKALKAKNIHTIAALKGEGLEPLVFDMWKNLEVERTNNPIEVIEEPDEEIPVMKPLTKSDNSYTIKQIKNEEDKQVFLISGKRLNQIVIMSDFTNDEAIARVYDILKKRGILKQLRRMGAEEGDWMMINKQKIEYLDLHTFRK